MSPSAVALVAASFGWRLGELRDVSTVPQDEHVRDVRFAFILATHSELVGSQVHPFEDSTWWQAADAHLHRQFRMHVDFGR